MADCQRTRGRLEAFAEKELTRKARERVEDHLATCPQCAAALEGLKAGASEAPRQESQWQGVWDSFTGLLTKKAFVDRLSEEVERARRYGRTLGLVFFDIDFFKKVNDTYGHMAGDYVLKGVAARIGEALRDEDILARYGGEEFTVILRGTGSEAAVMSAERIRKLIESKPFKFEKQEIPITISVGVATLNDGNFKGTKEFLARADECLYRSKEGGRNRVSA